MRTVFLLAFVAGLACAASDAPDVDEIIGKNIQAQGGLEKLKALQSVHMTGTLSMGGFRAGIVEDIKRGNQVREDFVLQGMTQVQAYDGKVAWQINPFGGRRDAELLSEDDAKSLVEDSDIEGLLVDYKAKGYQAELVGHDPVEGTDCYKIKLTLKNGDLRYFYLDTGSMLEIKSESQRKIRGATQYIETMYGDYEQVDGIYFPFAMDTAERGSQQHAKVTIDKVQVNQPLADTLFTMPESKAPAKSAKGN